MNAILTPEQFCREFAKKYPTPNVLQGVHLAEQGVLPWRQVADVFAQALNKAVTE